MTEFIDIAPLTFTEEVRGNQVTVRGVELADIAMIVARFPEVAGMFDIKAKKPKIDAKAIATLSVKLQAALIAAGIDRISEKGAANLTPGERALLISRILVLTVPSPPGPFLEALRKITGKDSADSEEPENQ
jgi:hypothetical protein